MIILLGKKSLQLILFVPEQSFKPNKKEKLRESLKIVKFKAQGLRLRLDTKFK
jgi:hypothetical protein